jgi:ribosomal-protein-alanine N-acetyltransferase
MKEINEIETEHLILIPLTLDQLKLCLTDLSDLSALGQESALSIADELVTAPVRRAIGLKLAKMEQVDPQLHPWFTYWLLVVIADRCGAGLVGFKGSPDEQGEVEIGYGIAPAYRGQGYTTEAARALIAWAFSAPDCTSVIATGVDSTNIASIRILEKVGMTCYQEKDGLLFWRIFRPEA